MIENRLAVIMAERLMKITELSEKTGIPRATLTQIYYRRSNGIRFETLDKICNALGCETGEVFRYTAEKEPQAMPE